MKNIKDLKTTEWLRLRKEENKKPNVKYNEHRDVLYMYFVPVQKKERILTYYIDRYAALLFRAVDNEIVGICFEGFKRSFFPAHIEKEWRLVDTKIELDGVQDFHISIHSVQEPKPAPHYTIPKPIDQNVSFEPVYA